MKAFVAIVVDLAPPDDKLSQMALTARPLSSSGRASWTGRGCIRAALLCVAAVAGLPGCGDDERAPPLRDRGAVAVPGCEAERYALCDVLDSECQDAVWSLMRCMRNDSLAVELPPVQLLDEAGAVELIARVVEGLPSDDDARPPGDFVAQIRGLEMLGLIDAGVLSSETDLIDVGIDALLAFYLIPTREVVIIDRGAPLDDLDANGVLAHELVHALQDAEHDLGAFGRRYADNSDLSLATSSVVEGEATLYQLQMMSAYMGVTPGTIDYDRLFDYAVATAHELRREEGSPFVTASSVFPYTYGARFAGDAWLEGGDVALDGLFDDPPRTSLEVIGEGGDEGVVQISGEAISPLEGYTLVSDDVAGAWVVGGLLDVHELASPTQVDELTAAWRGDRFWIFQGEEDALISLWTVRFEAAAAAEAFAGAMSLYAPPAGELSVVLQGESVHLIVADGVADVDAWAGRLSATSP